MTANESMTGLRNMIFTVIRYFHVKPKTAAKLYDCRNTIRELVVMTQGIV